MLKRTDIVDAEMLNDLKVIAGFNCRDWKCESCPLYTLDGDTGCVSIDVQRMLENYDDGKEVIF